MSKTPKQIDHVAILPETVPFVGPEAQERTLGKIFEARIGANENVFGPSPKAIEAIKNAASEVWMYADPEALELREALAEHHGVGVENIVIGGGIDNLLDCATRLYVEPGVNVVTSAGAYPTFNFHVSATGGNLELVSFVNDCEDPGSLLERARDTSAKLLYISNPDNPMGTWWDSEAMERMISSIPDGCMMLLDEAYIDTAPPGTAPPIDITNDQILRFRTFSKAYGLAGSRVGYCIGEAGIIRGFEKVRNHFGMNRVALDGALAALKDQDYLVEVVEKIANARARIAEIAEKHGFKPIASATNFVAMDCGHDSDYALALMKGLAVRGVFIRMPGAEPLSRCIRISAGTAQDLQIFDDALGEIISEIG
ncbi:MAG: pyridoxal phosphate-dependent aminotransferase [Rhizobiaceae bacterium]|nr:pyridoxal phosphate-dependent aminotransferase [Rhizobiaceae bacterium]